MGSQNFERLRIAVVKHDNLADCAVGDAGGYGCSTRFSVDRKRTEQHLIKNAVIGTCKDGDFVAPGDCTSHSSGGQYRFRTGVDKPDTLHASKFPYERGDFTCERLNRADFETAVQLFVNGLYKEWRAVPEHIGTETHDKIHVLVAIHIPNFRSVGSCGYDRIDHFLSESVETGSGSWISQDPPVFSSYLFRSCGALGIPRN